MTRNEQQQAEMALARCVIFMPGVLGYVASYVRDCENPKDRFAELFDNLGYVARAITAHREWADDYE